jgi:hypothetical protein
MSETLQGIPVTPGDVLLYRGTGLWSLAIRIKTFSPVSHAEIAAGQGRAFAARASGVGTYPLRTHGLYAILRPTTPLTAFEWAALERAHLAHDGLPYDWWGLLSFFRPDHAPDGPTQAFCSEHVARVFKLAGRPLFGYGYPSDQVPPGMFFASPLLDVVWQDS